MFVRSESASQNNRKTATSSQRKAEPAKGLAGWWRKLIGAEGASTPAPSGICNRYTASPKWLYLRTSRYFLSTER